MINNLHIPTCVVLIFCKFQNTQEQVKLPYKNHRPIAHNVLKHYVVWNEILTKFLFYSHTISFISYFLLPSKLQNLRDYFLISLLIQVQNSRIYLSIFFYTKNSAIVHDNHNFLISNTEVTEFPDSSILNAFQSIRIRIYHLLHSSKSCQSNDVSVGWPVQCAVCSALKLDIFTLETVAFEWLGWFRKT